VSLRIEGAPMATLPHETNELFITDGGLETSLVFQ
jgi:hypothetical protein